MTWTTCDIYDQFEGRARTPDVTLAGFGGRTAFSGRIVTVKCFEDNARLKALSGQPGDGRVIVVDGGGSRRCALLGDMIAADLAKNGWAGVVIFGCVRDVAALREIDLGVQALASTPRKSVRRGEGQVDIPVSFGGMEWRPGEVLFADEDGVLTLSADDAAGVG